MAGRPLLHCGSPPGQVPDPSLTCRDPRYCQCYGSNVSDLACSNDNFGGDWLLPGKGGAPPTYVYAQARRISAFAPHAVAYDNLAEVRRILVTWQTTTGLDWTSDYWDSLDEGGPSMHDGALPMLSDAPAVQEECKSAMLSRFSVALSR